MADRRFSTLRNAGVSTVTCCIYLCHETHGGQTILNAEERGGVNGHVVVEHGKHFHEVVVAVLVKHLNKKNLIRFGFFSNIETLNKN